MATHFLDTSAALDGRLNAMASLPPVAWPNLKYEPVIGTLYLRPTNLQGETIPVTENDMTVGIYQIDIFAESGSGKNEAIVMSDTVADQFKLGTKIVYNAKTVEIKNVRRREVSNDDNGWFHMIIEAEYFIFTTRR